MKYSKFHRTTTGTTASSNLTLNVSRVKVAVNKLSRHLMGVFAVACAIAAPLAHAGDPGEARVRAMRNAEQLSTLLHGVLPEQLKVMVDSIATGKVKRMAPEQPVWVLETISSSILYYQGQPGFAGQSADRLVDDNGQRFGLKALQNAKASRDTWMTVSMGGQNYPAYCVAQYPTVVCSLGVGRK
jgi:hypothetical protein